MFTVHKCSHYFFVTPWYKTSKCPKNVFGSCDLNLKRIKCSLGPGKFNLFMCQPLDNKSGCRLISQKYFSLNLHDIGYMPDTSGWRMMCIPCSNSTGRGKQQKVHIQTTCIVLQITIVASALKCALRSNLWH